MSFYMKLGVTGGILLMVAACALTLVPYDAAIRHRRIPNIIAVVGVACCFFAAMIGVWTS